MTHPAGDNPKLEVYLSTLACSNRPAYSNNKFSPRSASAMVTAQMTNWLIVCYSSILENVLEEDELTPGARPFIFEAESAPRQMRQTVQPKYGVSITHHYSSPEIPFDILMCYLPISAESIKVKVKSFIFFLANSGLASALETINVNQINLIEVLPKFRSEQ